MKFAEPRTLESIASQLGADLVPASAGDNVIDGINLPEYAGSTDLVWVETKQAEQALREHQPAAVITRRPIENLGIPFLCHPHPKLAFAQLLREFLPTGEGDPATAEIHPSARIDPSAHICGDVKIGARTVVKAGAVIGYGCSIGDDCYVGFNTVLNWGTQLGNRVSIHNCSVLGTDGFGYVQQPAPDQPGLMEHIKVPHVGPVVVEDDVEIGSNTCIDRGMLHPTVIGRGTKIDNLVQIGHNCQIGRYNIIIGLAGLSGSVVTGDNVIICGQAGVADHTKVGDRTVLMAATKVMGDIPAESHLIGYPPLPRRQFFKWTSALMDVTLVKRILKAVSTAESFDDFKEKMNEIKSIDWPTRW